jgi:hypothetical protein
MPRREGEVFRFGTAMAGKLLVPASGGKAGLIGQTKRSGKPWLTGATAACRRRRASYVAADCLLVGIATGVILGIILGGDY